MQSIFHTIAVKSVSLYFVTLSFLGWTTPEKVAPTTPSPVSQETTSNPSFKQEATSTVISKKPQPLPYLQIFAPEFKLIPINRPIAQNPTPSPTGFPTPSVTPTESAPTTSLANAVVNIYCTIRSGNTITGITGSGVVVSSKGIVITNPHVAQYVLIADYLKDPNRSCEVRTGSVARSSYKAHVLYLSPEWVRNNAGNLKDNDPKGTGEFDYAFLALSDGAKKVPDSIPYVNMENKVISSGNSVIAMGYPAEHLDGQTVSQNLKRVQDTSIIGRTYSFGYTNTDLITVESDTVAQKGSSGGAVFGNNGNLNGIIVTSIPNPQTGHTSLAALSSIYITNEYYSSSGKTLSTLFSGNPNEKYAVFSTSIGFDLARTLLNN